MFPKRAKLVGVVVLLSLVTPQYGHSEKAEGGGCGTVTDFTDGGRDYQATDPGAVDWIEVHHANRDNTHTLWRFGWSLAGHPDCG
jgi:hypothetical protein